MSCTTASASQLNLAKRHIWSDIQSLIRTESIKVIWFDYVIKDTSFEVSEEINVLSEIKSGENVFVVDNFGRELSNINFEITNKNWIRCLRLEKFNKRRKLIQKVRDQQTRGLI